MPIRKNGQLNPKEQLVPARTLGQAEKKTRTYTSLKRERLINNLLSGKFKTLKAAMLDAGYSENTADDQTAEVLGNPRVRTAMQEAMVKDGVDENRLTKIISEGLDATKVISAMVVAPSGEGMKDAGGTTKDFIEVPDYIARHKFLETALELRGDYPDKKSKLEVTGSFESWLRKIKDRKQGEKVGDKGY